jgi:Na+-driven multidrug efflux pump
VNISLHSNSNCLLAQLFHSLVAAFAIVGNLWEVCLSATEGLGESASVRVSYYLSEGFPIDAKLLSSKVAFWACVQAMVITSIFLVAGPNISESLTTDTVLQTIINNLLGLTSLANIPMTLAQVYWSLVGAQGRYAVASAAILLSRWLVTMPLSAICVFGYSYDVDSLAGSVATGYATAAFVLSLHIFNADWMGLSISAQEELLPFDEDGDLSSDSSSGHF